GPAAPAQGASDDAQFSTGAFHAAKPITMRGSTVNLRHGHRHGQPSTFTAGHMGENQGFFGRMRERLARSANRLADDFTGLFRGRQIDAELLDELEARLIGADIGVAATTHILEKLRASVARRELSDAAALVGALRTELLAI